MCILGNMTLVVAVRTQPQRTDRHPSRPYAYVQLMKEESSIKMVVLPLGTSLMDKQPEIVEAAGGGKVERRKETNETGG